MKCFRESLSLEKRDYHSSYTTFLGILSITSFLIILDVISGSDKDV